MHRIVFVPIRGLFNLTEQNLKQLKMILYLKRFRPHQGIIYFNKMNNLHLWQSWLSYSFRPHRGII